MKHTLNLTEGQCLRIHRGTSEIRFAHKDRAPAEPFPFRNHRTVEQVDDDNQRARVRFESDQ
jgi:hypothetical protein